MTDTLQGLPQLASHELERLAKLIDMGRVPSPATAISLAQEGFGGASGVATDLERLVAEGFGATQITMLLHALAAVQRRGEDIQNCIEIVVTGPDAAATSRDTAVVIGELFSSASRSVLATGFAVHDGRSVFRRLAERMDAIASLETTICLDISRQPGDTAREDEVLSRFAERFRTVEWPGQHLPKLFFDPRALLPWDQRRAVLHAKCVVVDDVEALVTSANLTTAAQERNIELGLLVRNPIVATAIRQHFERLIEKGHLRRVPI